jgi:proline iminopeptidase
MFCELLRLETAFSRKLAVVGEDDFVCPPSRAKIMHQGIANSELVVLEVSGHLAHVEEPEAFFEAVEGWVERN